MKVLVDDLVESLGRGSVPSLAELVERDGFDELEKDYAVAFFLGKSWQDVLAYLHTIRGDPLRGAAYQLEEWSVLQPGALTYYARAYVEHLRRELECAEPDEAFIAEFFGQLCQVIYIHQGSPFTPAQTFLFKSAASYVDGIASVRRLDGYFRNDIEHRIAAFLGELAVHTR